MRPARGSLLVGVALLAACGGGTDRAPEAAPGLVTAPPSAPLPSTGAAPGTGPYVGACLDLPDPAPPHDWLPEGLPLPEGTYLVEPPVGAESFRSATLAVPMAWGEFMEFALSEWPSHGWETMQTEVEFMEADAAFVRDDEWGTFQVRLVYCEENWSEVALSVGTD